MKDKLSIFKEASVPHFPACTHRQEPSSCPYCRAERAEAEVAVLRAVAQAAQDVYDNRVPAGMKAYDFLWIALGRALNALPKKDG